MGFSDEDYTRALTAVGVLPKSEVPRGTTDEMDETLWLLFNGRPIAEVLEEVRQRLLRATESHTGSRESACEILEIGTTSYYRIKNGGNKYSQPTHKP
jgi:hypothetical protein